MIIRGALHQITEVDEAAGEWVTKTYSASFVIEERDLAGIPGEGEKVNIGPEEAPLDYWAVVSAVEELEAGRVEVTAELDVEAQIRTINMKSVAMKSRKSRIRVSTTAALFASREVELTGSRSPEVVTA